MFKNATCSKQATVRPFFKQSSSIIPAPPSSLHGIFGSQAFPEDDDDDDVDITASQLFRQNNFKVPKAPRSILRQEYQPTLRDPLQESFFSSQISLPDRQSQYDDDTRTATPYDDLDNADFDSISASQHTAGSQRMHSQIEDVLPSSQLSRSGQRFIPSFPSQRVRIADTESSQQRPATSRTEVLVPHKEPPSAVAEMPFYPLSLPEYTTPGGTTHGSQQLRSVNEILNITTARELRRVFPFPYFNIVQSKVLDDVLYTDKHMVLCAPTGSGKTAVFELAIVRLLIAMGEHAKRAKIVYMAPIKALCSQRCLDWKAKFEPLGLKCQELTGDTEMDDYFQLQEVNIVMTTPEKWDSMTRKWRDNRSLVQLVKLFLIDEVHSLNDEFRGATVEAVISRMKTVQAAVVRAAASNDHTEAAEVEEGQGLRFMAVSATIPNIVDVAAWLETGGQHAVWHRLDESHRPVKLRKVVLSYPCSERQSEFRFDLSLNYKLGGVIHTYSDQKPTLVFCATRKSVQQAASILVKEARFIMGVEHRQRLQKVANFIRETKLRELLVNGVGYHHAGLDLQDRKHVEEMFLNGDLPVLIATSTLAMGVNLPAHLVVIKSTQHYVSGMYCEYTETQILQMIGRAGRPQFDTSATAVIMTKHESKKKYLSLLSGSDDIESSLHNHLIEHLNAEIVLHTISDISVALEWLKSTFLYIRIMKNPAHYKIPAGLNKEQIEKKLQDMCIKDLNLLSNFKLIKMDAETMDLKPLETGRLMARYCIAFDTMKQFSKISGSETIEELMIMLCTCKEFTDIQLRVNERKTLNMLNKDKNRATIRFPMQGKIKTTDMKVNCLVQATLGCLPIQDFALSQDSLRIFRAGQRLTRCLLEYLMQRSDFNVLLHTALIAKCFKARLWENSKNVTRQIDKIGPALGTALVNAGIVSFQKLESTNPREVELILNRHPPFGNQILEAVTHLPKYDVSVEQALRYSPQLAEITFTVSLVNRERLMEKQTAKSNHCCLLLIGDSDNCIVLKQRIMDVQLLRGPWCKKIDVNRANRGEELCINLISQDYVGLDVQSTYTPFYSGPKHLRVAPTESNSTCPSMHPSMQSAKNARQGLKRKQLAPSTTLPQWLQNDEMEPRTDDEELSLYWNHKPCNHRCSNKDSCAHECCKIGVPIRPPAATTQQNKKQSNGQKSSAVQKSSSAATRPPKLSRLEQYFSELHSRTDSLPQMHSLPRIRVTQDNSTPNVHLDRFAFTPRRKGTPSLSTVPDQNCTPNVTIATPDRVPSSAPSITAETPIPTCTLNLAPKTFGGTSSLAPNITAKTLVGTPDLANMAKTPIPTPNFAAKIRAKTPLTTPGLAPNNMTKTPLPTSSCALKTPTATPSLASKTPACTPSSKAKTPTKTPASGKGWEMLNFYQQFRHEISYGIEEEIEEENIQGPPLQETSTLNNYSQTSKTTTQDCSNTSTAAPQNTDTSSGDKLHTNNTSCSKTPDHNADVSWSDSDQEALIVDRYVQGDEGMNEFQSYPESLADHTPQRNQDQQTCPNIPQHEPVIQTQHRQNPTSQFDQHQHPGVREQQPSAQLESTTRRGQALAWSSPISNFNIGVNAVLASPPIYLSSSQPFNNAGDRRRTESNQTNRAPDFISARTLWASTLPANSTTSRPRQGCESRILGDKELQRYDNSTNSPDFFFQSSGESREDLPNILYNNSDTSVDLAVPPDDTDNASIITISDEETNSDTGDNAYFMNSSSDDEFLYSCLEVESREASKAEQDPKLREKSQATVHVPHLNESTAKEKSRNVYSPTLSPPETHPFSYRQNRPPDTNWCATSVDTHSSVFPQRFTRPKPAQIFKMMKSANLASSVKYLSQEFLGGKKTSTGCLYPETSEFEPSYQSPNSSKQASIPRATVRPSFSPKEDSLYPKQTSYLGTKLSYLQASFGDTETPYSGM